MVHLVLKIKSFEDVGRWLSLAPDERLYKLGKYTYETYLDTIVNLVTIWHYSMTITDPVPYDEFLQFQNEYEQGIQEAYTAVLNKGN